MENLIEAKTWRKSQTEERTEPSPFDRIVGIPAHNEENSIAKVIVESMDYADEIIVIDDGSTDSTAAIARALGVTLISHRSNMGKGAALRTLMEEAAKRNPNVVITIDADGQHDPADIPVVAEPVLKGEADVVVGVRELEAGTAPRHRVMGNKALSVLTSAKAGERFHDTQSGLRAYSLKALDKIRFSQQGMAIESQTLIDAASSGLVIREVPVSVNYTGKSAKRNPLGHLSEVADYLLTRTVVDSPLLYLGLPGLVMVAVGIVAGVQVLNVFAATKLIAIGTALVSVALVIVGTVMVATSLILKFLRAFVRQ